MALKGKVKFLTPEINGSKQFSLKKKSENFKFNRSKQKILSKTLEFRPQTKVTLNRSLNISVISKPRTYKQIQNMIDHCIPQR